MKFFTPLLLCLSLALGTIASMTAYLPRLDAVEQATAAGIGLELAAPSGKATGPDGTVVPVAFAGERLTPDLVAKLRGAGVERVRVRQFSFARWSHRWLFAASCAGLAVGAALVRRAGRKTPADSTNGPAGGGLSPGAALASTTDALRRLDSEMPALRGTDGGMRRVTEILGELQATHLDAIVQSRGLLVAAGGLAGFAAFMSAFSMMERQVNRAWSAAADDAGDEVADCVKRALILSDDAERLLPRRQAESRPHG